MAYQKSSFLRQILFTNRDHLFFGDSVIGNHPVKFENGIFIHIYAIKRLNNHELIVSIWHQYTDSGNTNLSVPKSSHSLQNRRRLESKFISGSRQLPKSLDLIIVF